MGHWFSGPTRHMSSHEVDSSALLAKLILLPAVMKKFPDKNNLGEGDYFGSQFQVTVFVWGERQQ